MSFKQGKAVKVEQLEGGVQKVVLQRNDGTYFVVREYRIGQTHTVGEQSKFPIANEIEDIVNAKGTVFKQYSNEHKTNDSPTYVPQDGPTTKDIPAISEIPIENRIEAGIIMVLSCSLDKSPEECHNLMKAYASKLMN